MSLGFLGFAENVEFANPEFLAILPILVLLFLLQLYRNKLASAAVQFGAFPLLQKVAPGFAVKLRHLPNAALWLASLAITFALARPVVVDYETLEEILDYGADIILTLDVSESMAAMDFRPSRLAVSQEVVKDFITKRSGDHVGMVAFAGSAVTYCPLTSNLEYLGGKVDELDFGLLDDGTAIGSSLATSINRLAGSKAKSKVIILLTDGMNNRGEILPRDAAKMAADEAIKIYTIGIGSEGQVPMPNRAPWYGRRMATGFDEALLQEIAATTEAQYYKASDRETLEEIYDTINELEKTEVKSRTYSYEITEEYFHPFLYAAVVLFILYLIFSMTRFRVLP